jgi:peptide/nickel transport system ATP-binding protein
VVQAVDGVSLELESGYTLGLVGESGSGKTVTGRSIMGLTPASRGVERSGTVMFDGQDMLSLRTAELRRIWGRDIGMVFQDPNTSLNPVMTIGSQIAESLRYHRGLSRREAQTEAAGVLGSVGIQEPRRRCEQYPHELSGGMKQRVMIGIALAGSPRLLIADEPTSALDVTVQSTILDLLAAEQSDRAMAMILITHSLAVAANWTDHIAVMYGGQIVETGPTRTLFTDMRMPYTEALVRSVPPMVGPRHVALSAIPGRPPDPLARPSGCAFAPRCAYAQDRCREEAPRLVDGPAPGHRYACFYPVGTREGLEALARNRARAVPTRDATVELAVR